MAKVSRDSSQRQFSEWGDLQIGLMKTVVKARRRLKACENNPIIDYFLCTLATLILFPSAAAARVGFGKVF